MQKLHLTGILVSGVMKRHSKIARFWASTPKRHSSPARKWENSRTKKIPFFQAYTTGERSLCMQKLYLIGICVCKNPYTRARKESIV